MVVQPFYLSSLSPCLPPHLGFLLLLCLLLWELGMKNPTMAGLIFVSMENMVRDIDGTSICDETKRRTKWTLLGELGAHIHWSSIISSLIDCLVAFRILKTSMYGDFDWSRNVREESLVDS